MHIKPEYQSALDYIFSFVDFSKTHTANLAPENFNLDRMRSLLERLGNPHQAYPSIHIAGTKGKGSTSALCSSALSAAGYKTGLYTSPHLQDFSERIQINCEPIAQDALVSLLERIRHHIESVPGISTFEIMTALAMQHFADEKVDAAVLEVGLGGRLDATNVVTPLVSVITSISIDHVPILGSTLAEIASEKAGIIKPGIPVVVAPQKSEANLAIRSIAAKQNAPLITVGKEVEFKAGSFAIGRQELVIRDQHTPWTTLAIPLLGLHQIENAATAWTALRSAAESGLNISDDAIRRGFAEVKWPGRFEILRRSPTVILDAAHNADSALRLTETLDQYFPDQPLHLVVGFSGDKAIADFLKPFAGRTKQVIATRSVHPRALDPEALREIAAEIGMMVTCTQNIEEALELGLEGLKNEDVLLVTGSVFVVGGAREVWGKLHHEL